MSAATADFLARVVERRRADVARLRAERTREDLAVAAADGRPPMDLGAALRHGPAVAVIAEVKKASPSAGPIAPGVDPAAQARRYRRGGAAAVSVLTEPSWFGGSFDDLRDVASSSDRPVLCKDFVVDEAQTYLARSCGADAVLLMVSVLGRDLARHLALARELGMDGLVEVVSRTELDLAIASGAGLVAVNARDLRTLRVDRARARALVSVAAAAGTTVVAASGVRDRADVEVAAAAGASAVLVGETVMRADDPAAAVAGLTGVARGGSGS